MTDIKLSFLDVGQGDTILINWKTKNGKNCLGIIDCKKIRIGRHTKAFKETNNFFVTGSPSKIRIGEFHFDSIEFLILSHPHRDHYSGLGRLIKYCQEHNIKIKKVFTTFEKINAYRVAQSQKVRSEITELEDQENPKDELFKYYCKILGPGSMNHLFGNLRKMFSAHDNGVIGDILYIDPGEINLGISNSKVTVFSPSGIERKNIDEFGKEAFQANAPEDDGKLINGLSTVLRIKIFNHEIWLTADALPSSLNKIAESLNDGDSIKDILVQVPHHGSKNNHSTAFYKSLKDNCTGKKIAVVSSGFNERLKHPHEIVINSLRSLGFRLYSTNYVHGIANSFKTANSKRWNGDTTFRISRESITIDT